MRERFNERLVCNQQTGESVFPDATPVWGTCRSTSRTRLYVRFLLSGLVFVIGAWCAPAVEAQVPAVPSYAPSSSPFPASAPSSARPKFSHYLNLFRRDAGLLPNYHKFVRPQQQLNLLEQQQYRQWQAVEGLQRDLVRYEQQAIRSTGRGGTFMNYLHFYPSPR